MAPVDAADLATRFPPVQLGFDLREEPGLTPPPGVAALRGRDSLSVNLAVGAHYFYTCLTHREPSFNIVQEFLDSTTDTSAPHTFIGSNWSDDDEWNRSLSKQYSKLVGIAFMATHAESTWFARVKWNSPFGPHDDRVRFRKQDPDMLGPDFVAAPFDPEQSGLPDPFHVLEFKGRSAEVSFDSPAFGKWRSQARNIVCRDADGDERSLKSWVLAFNYAFEVRGRGRTHSALLVDDPLAGPPDVERMAPTRRNIEPIIRAHLARNARKLGAGMLTHGLLSGRVPERPRWPQLFRIDHPKTRGRLYVGGFASLDPTGSLVWSSAPVPPMLGALHHYGHAHIDVEVHGPDHAFLHARVRHRGQGRVALVDVHVHGGMPGLQTDADARRWLESMLGGSRRDQLFLGQDATMLRGALQTPVGQGLVGTPFTDLVQVQGGHGEGESPKFIQVLRNGSALASAHAVEAVEPGPDWWYELDH